MHWNTTNQPDPLSLHAAIASVVDILSEASSKEVHQLFISLCDPNMGKQIDWRPGFCQAPVLCERILSYAYRERFQRRSKRS